MSIEATGKIRTGGVAGRTLTPKCAPSAMMCLNNLLQSRIGQIQGFSSSSCFSYPSGIKAPIADVTFPSVSTEFPVSHNM